MTFFTKKKKKGVGDFIKEEEGVGKIIKVGYVYIL